jgi:hypothetical protein
MRHIKLFEDFHIKDLEPEFDDTILQEICVALRAAGYKDAAYGERGDQEMFISVDPMNAFLLWDVDQLSPDKAKYLFNRINKEKYKEGGDKDHFYYTEGSKDVKDIISILKK